MMNKIQLLGFFIFLYGCCFGQQNIGMGTGAPEALLHLKTTNWIKTIFENASGQPRGYVGSDANGTVTLSSNAYWNGSNWVYPSAGSSLYLLLHRVNNQFEFRVRPEGGNQNTAMVIHQNGNVGIGTSNPQAILDLGVGGNRFIRFKNDLIPTLEVVSGNVNDPLAGALRLRNILEIWPNAAGSIAGKLDVRNTAGNATITLNGSTGIIQANSIQASSVNATSLIASGGISAESVYAPNLPAIAFNETERGGCPTLGQGGNVVLESFQATFPTSGYARITGRIHLCTMPGGCGFNLTLQDNTPAQFQVLRTYYFQDLKFEATDILWVGPVQAGTRTYELKMVNSSSQSSCDIKYLNSNLIIEFFDRKIN